jgi:ferritin-like metal-binding protein YciE
MRIGELDGTWDVQRVSGALPPMVGVRKVIDGAAGYTELAGLRLPFRVEGLRLVYRGLPLVDELEPDERGFAGRATLAGREYGRFALRPTLTEEDSMTTTSDLERELGKHIDEAIAMEQTVLRLLDSVIYGMDDEEVREALRLHKVETERHIDRLQARLEVYGRSPSFVREAGGIVSGLMKSVLDLTRGEKAARGARDAYATEHLEIASYQLLERLAERAGDEATAQVARDNRAEEEKMAAWIDDHWDRFADLALAEKVVHAP